MIDNKSAIVFFIVYYFSKNEPHDVGDKCKRALTSLNFSSFERIFISWSP